MRIDSLSVDSGAAWCRIALGRPRGQRALRLRSVKDVRIERPAGIPVRIELSGGGVNITFDKAQFGAVGGVLMDQTEGYDDAGDRYLVTVDGGADTLVVARGAPG